MLLYTPDMSRLSQYLDALRRGWTPDCDFDPHCANEVIMRIEANPETFIQSLSNPRGGGTPVELTDGTLVPRLAHVRFWIWDDSYCGDINLRWQPGTSELPPYCDGHVSYAVVPWKRGRGLAATALRELVAVARGYGLAWLDISMSSANIASIRTAEAAGALLHDEYVAVEQGGVLARRYRLCLPDS